MHFRKLLSQALALLMLVAMISIGCGGVQEEAPRLARSQAEAPTMAELPSIEVPEKTSRQMKACVDARVDTWAEPSHALQYNIVVNDQGNILRVNLHDTTLRDGPLEACFQRALAAMEVPIDALSLRTSRPVSVGKRMTREQRGPLSSSESESPFVFLGPLILEAGGTKVLVDIGLMVVAGVVALAATLDADDPEQICQDRYMDCLLTDMGARRGHKFDHSRCQWCREACIRGKGIWPSRTEGATGKSCEYWRRGK